MEIDIRTVENVTVVAISGDLDASTSPAAQLQVLTAAQPGSRILLDLTNVSYMSSAGLRMLLTTYRQLSSTGGRIVLLGVAEEIVDTMTVTGFRKFFTLVETPEAGLHVLQQ